MRKTSKRKTKIRGSLTEVVQEYSSRTSVHGLAYISDPLLSFKDRNLWLLLFLGCVVLAIFLNISAYREWRGNQVVTNMKENGRPVSEVPFPTLTICGMGLNMVNVEKRLMKDFETWRQENRRLKEENIEDDMADFMAEVFEIKDRETNILDILNTRVFLKMQTSFL